MNAVSPPYIHHCVALYSSDWFKLKLMRNGSFCSLGLAIPKYSQNKEIKYQCIEHCRTPYFVRHHGTPQNVASPKRGCEIIHGHKFVTSITYSPYKNTGIQKVDSGTTVPENLT
ncbi:hypothetical protein L798_07350 [Zootermopsis nevadensis]|uniref:Uncharacterized protein n=1 Tax=Zootermopsis nevadensis TaxID=136037 RepID=A0A067R7T1_ZOONE|nr:hypothetical protein L798_07350 [Zootermopsis nevadensis]